MHNCYNIQNVVVIELSLPVKYPFDTICPKPTNCSTTNKIPSANVKETPL
jgi:hypothetical protein